MKKPLLLSLISYQALPLTIPIYSRPSIANEFFSPFAQEGSAR
jgi:hypothetical protein